MLVTRDAPVTIADVARALGVTRQTVYRYFPNTDAILIAVATRSTDGFLDMVESHLRGITRPTEAIVEAMAFAVETLAGDDRINLMLGAPDTVVSESAIVSSTSIAAVNTMLGRLEVDWAASGFDEDALADLSEFILRLLYSYLVDRNAVPHDGVRLRRFLARWVGPAVAYTSMADAVKS
ncbi:MAG: TetR/AcrR family transcriptional regulator [Williamsia herbipolensis]|nr:TetR/AcrR family transcriptional regulator [Williamsia herbipolensis]